MIEKKIALDAIEIVGDFRHIQTRLKVELVEDGVVIGRLPNIRLAAKAPSDDITAHKDINLNGVKIPVPQEIKDELRAVANSVWTDTIKNKYAEYLAKKSKAK